MSSSQACQIWRTLWMYRDLFKDLKAKRNYISAETIWHFGNDILNMIRIMVFLWKIRLGMGSSALLCRCISFFRLLCDSCKRSSWKRMLKRKQTKVETTSENRINHTMHNTKRTILTDNTVTHGNIYSENRQRAPETFTHMRKYSE